MNITGNAPGRANPQPPTETCLGERPVACDCDPRLYRHVLVDGSEPGINACLGCGTVTVSWQRGDDGHHTGNACSAYFAAAVAQPIVDWLGAWPRVSIEYTNNPWPLPAAWTRPQKVYHKADFRCSDPALLAVHESDLRREAAQRPEGERLRAACPRLGPPPAGIPRALLSFVDLWEVLQLTHESDLHKLLWHARIGRPGSGIAAGLLARRRDAVQVARDAIWSDDPAWQAAGHALVCELASQAAPTLAEAVLGRLESLPLTPSSNGSGRLAGCGQMEELLLILTRLDHRTDSMEQRLRQFLRRIATLDSTLADYCQRTMRSLRHEPVEPPAGFTF